MLRKTGVLILTAAFCFAVSSVACAANLLVPSEYVTIQAAIDSAADGDTITVTAGTYQENINFNGVNIILTSVNPEDAVCVATTIIQGTGAGPVVTFEEGENNSCVLTGFTITGGGETWEGGGIYCDGSSPTISKCNIIANSADYGGGMYNDGSGPMVSDCTFSGNSAEDGGGMYNEESNPTLTGCAFSGNLAEDEGGGIYNEWDSNTTVSDCTFSGNWAIDGGGMYSDDSRVELTECTFSDNSAEDGGAMYNEQSTVILTECTLSGNSAGDEGGGMYNSRSSVEVTQCRFSGNVAVWDGGGICNNHSDPNLTGCIFSGNRADIKGGGIYSDWDSSPILRNCTLTGNWAGSKGGGMCNYRGEPTLTNCILWENSADEGAQIACRQNSNLSVWYSNIEEGVAMVYVRESTVEWGEGNIDADPCFVTAGVWDDNGTPDDEDDDLWIDGDYHLKSEGWRWDSDANSWVWDDVTTRCIDAGNPASAPGEELLSVPEDPLNARGVNLRINMGAYGGTAEASMPPYDWAILGDLNNDGIVNLIDSTLQANNWLISGSEICGDLDRNEIVDAADLALLMLDWLVETSWYTP